MRISPFVAAAALVCLAACSHAHSSSTDASTSAEATAAVTAAPAAADTGSVTVTTGNGAVTIGGSIDPSKLGVPVYPGMSQAGGSSYQVSTSNGGAVATYHTDDDFDKVYAFYKGQLPSDAEQMKTPQMAMFSTKVGGDTVTIEVIAKSGQGTGILITRSATK